MDVNDDRDWTPMTADLRDKLDRYSILDTRSKMLCACHFVFLGLDTHPRAHDARFSVSF